jgi:hypothetical protein
MLMVTGIGDEVDDEADAITIALRWRQEHVARSGPKPGRVLRALGGRRR